MSCPGVANSWDEGTGRVYHQSAHIRKLNFMLDTGDEPDQNGCMNRLPAAKRAQMLQMLCEGMSMRAVSRMAGVSINTVSKLLVDAGKFCAAFHDEMVRDVNAKRVQADEIWSFIAAKAKNVTEDLREKNPAAGDVWTWTAIDADTK